MSRFKVEGFKKNDLQNLKSSNFRVLKVFNRKIFKIQILDSQSQQKIAAFQSNCFCLYL